MNDPTYATFRDDSDCPETRGTWFVNEYRDGGRTTLYERLTENQADSIVRALERIAKYRI